MVKFLFAILLLLTVKSVSAQVTAKATVTATIVNPVGTEEISPEDLQHITLSAEQNSLSLPNLITNNQSTEINIAKFSVINGTSLYSITVQSNLSILPASPIAATNQLCALSVKPLNTTAKPESFTLGAKVDVTRLQKRKYPGHSEVDITVHFN